ncbi:MAG: histidine kinase [Betaproteobacteria bacterium RIFCSPLOWO2_02_FULL_62_17]|nr:MAG: histidine kinase [Betaproteobacteria bacterium RIFCSPLOWO2_02_FULL_62_17]
MSTILVVEDNENNMMLVRGVLQMKGYTVLEATTGTDGARLALECDPDLILMDIHLPDISGIETLTQIRAAPSVRKVPVIAVSASVMPEDQQQIIASGFDAYITKPLNMRSFLESVEKLFMTLS